MVKCCSTDFNMTDTNVERYFQSGQCLWPILDDLEVRKLAETAHITHAELGSMIRRMLKPVHFTCVPDRDLTCDAPKYTTYDPLVGHHNSDKLVRAKDLSKQDLQQMDDAEQEHKKFLRSKKHCLPYGWWDLCQHTYKY